MPNRPLIRLLQHTASCVALPLLISACGGGGGDGQASSSELRFGTLSPSTLTASYKESGTPTFTTLELSTSYSGVPSNNAVYVVVEDPDGLVTQAIPAFADGKATLTLQISKMLVAGNYSQPLTVHACKDPACKSEYAGSPQQVKKDLKVEGITLSKSSFEFTGSVGAGAPAQTLTVQAPAGVDFSLIPLIVERTDPSGTLGAMSPGDVFDFTRQGNQVVITPKPTWAGKYVMKTQVQGYDGYASKPVTLTYNVAGSENSPFTLATTSLNLTAADYTPVTASIDLIRNNLLFMPSLYMWQFSGLPDPAATGWIQQVSSEYTTDSAGRPVWRLVLKFDRCGRSLQCLGLGAGVYPVTAAIKIDGYGGSWTYTVPITYTAR